MLLASFNLYSKSKTSVISEKILTHSRKVHSVVPVEVLIRKRGLCSKSKYKIIQNNHWCKEWSPVYHEYPTLEDRIMYLLDSQVNQNYFLQNKTASLGGNDTSDFLLLGSKELKFRSLISSAQNNLSSCGQLNLFLSF